MDVKTGRKVRIQNRKIIGQRDCHLQQTKKRSSQAKPEKERALFCSKENEGARGKAIEHKSARAEIEKQQNQQSNIVW
jgi:hypothetical protein